MLDDETKALTMTDFANLMKFQGESRTAILADMPTFSDLTRIKES